MSRLRVICSLAAIIAVLGGLSVGIAQAAIVPELTGTFTGSAFTFLGFCNPFTFEPGFAFAGGATVDIGNVSSEWDTGGAIPETGDFFVPDHSRPN
jgi:hypothetical protein